MLNALYLPKQIHNRKNCFQNVGQIACDAGYGHIFIVTDPVMVQLGYIDTLKTLLKKQNITCDVYDNTIPEPTVTSLAEAQSIVATATTPYDAIIALGGGSVIDSAKAIAIWAKYGGDLQEYKMPRVVNEPGIPLIAIPTTAGTGSECTKNAVIADETTVEKLVFMGVGFLPEIAIIDYTLSLSCPKRLTADSGIDSLTHAVEAYVSKQANPMSDTIALHAMAHIFPHLRTVYHQPNNETAREHVMYGASLGGMAFSNASVALIHSMSHPMGAHFHIPHGMANAMLFPTVAKFSLHSALPRYAQCARACGMTDTLNDTQAGEIFVNELMALNQDLQVPTPEQFGITKDTFFTRIPTMADQSVGVRSAKNNPRIPSKQDIITLYQSLY